MCTRNQISEAYKTGQYYFHNYPKAECPYDPKDRALSFAAFTLGYNTAKHLNDLIAVGTIL